MKLLSMFGIGSRKILAMDCHVKGTVTSVRNSCLYVIKKPVRLYPNERNTKFSHWITFTYTVDNIPYTGKLFVSPYYRFPQKGEQIDVYYDPAKPERYACYAFGPGTNPFGW